MDRTERLLDLVALLLDTDHPLSWPELKAAFPEDYGQGAAEAAERKFERDKAELLELGVPLAYHPSVEEVPAGYIIDKAGYYLPELGLSPEELAVLYTAGSAALGSGAFPGREDLSNALRKLGFFADRPLAAARVRLELGGPATTQHLEALWGAVSSRKYVELEYASPRATGRTRRRVDPYGLALRNGTWSLVGYCHLRSAIRTFFVHRIHLMQVNPQKPKSPDFELPADFRLDAHVASWPWDHRFHPPQPVQVELRGELVPLAGSYFPHPVFTQGQVARVDFSATNLPGLAQYVLSLGPDARVVGGAEARATYRAMLERVVVAHGGARG